MRATMPATRGRRAAPPATNKPMASFSLTLEFMQPASSRPAPNPRAACENPARLDAGRLCPSFSRESVDMGRFIELSPAAFQGNPLGG